MANGYCPAAIPDRHGVGQPFAWCLKIHIFDLKDQECLLINLLPVMTRFGNLAAKPESGASTAIVHIYCRNDGRQWARIFNKTRVELKNWIVIEERVATTQA